MGKRRGYSRMIASRPDACGGAIALSYRRDARRVAQSRRCVLNQLLPACSPSPVISCAPAASVLELAGSTVVRLSAYSDLDVLGRRCQTGRGSRAWCGSRRQLRAWDGIRHWLFAAGTRRPAPSISRAKKACDASPADRCVTGTAMRGSDSNVARDASPSNEEAARHAAAPRRTNRQCSGRAESAKLRSSRQR